MNAKLLIATLSATGATALAVVPGTAVAAVSQQSAVSENWSGYAAADSSGGQFSSVSGSWVEPTVNCSSSGSYDAFWVGLGGTSGQQGDGLEQIGTQAACTGSGQAQHFAWYELVPAGPVRLDVPINPGDHISASVTVNGDNVTVSLDDQTSGKSVTKTLQMSDPDTSSAEWIAEAPSQCDSSGNCQTLPLADFGSVDFTNATATANGQTGPISDSDWTAQPVSMTAASGFVSTGGGSSTAGAEPSSLTSNGSGFTVTWQANDGSSSTGDSGAGDGYGYGGGGYGGYGSGDGGYSSGGYGGYGTGGYGGYGSGGGYAYGVPGAYSYGFYS